MRGDPRSDDRLWFQSTYTTLFILHRARARLAQVPRTTMYTHQGTQPNQALVCKRKIQYSKDTANPTRLCSTFVTHDTR